MHFVSRLGLLLASFLSLPAFAQQSDPPTTADPYYGSYLPQPGAYYDPAQPGSGVFVDVGPDGTMFVGVFHHDADGQPSFRTMQGTFAPTYAYPPRTSTSFRPEPANLGTLRSPLYITTGGNCLRCAPRTVSTVPDYVLGDATITWTQTRRATLAIGPRTWSLQMLNIDRGENELIDGEWIFAAWEGGTPFEGHFSQIAIEPGGQYTVSFVLPFAGSETAVYPLPGAGAKFHRVRCVARCAAFDAWRFVDGRLMDAYVWYEPSTGRAVFDQWYQTGFGPTTHYASLGRRFYELSLDEDLVTGRASYRGGTIGLGNESAAIAVEGSLMRLMRLPAGKQL